MEVDIRGTAKFKGSIGVIRPIEDSIRNTKKFTEALFHKKHPDPIQGEELPSRVFSRRYEVYPEIEWGLDMTVEDMVNWFWKDTPCIDVDFWYDYRHNRATVEIKGGNESVEKLEAAIPGLKDALTKALSGDTGGKAPYATGPVVPTAEVRTDGI